VIPLNGLRPGRVVSAADPEKRGRIRVRVPQVYGDTTEDEYVADEALPWAMPCFPSAGHAWTPPVGSEVWVAFWLGSPEWPVWLGAWYPVGAAPAEFVSAHMPEPMSRVEKTDNGHLFEMRWLPTQSRIELQSAAGAKIVIHDTPIPKIEVVTPGLVEVNAGGAVNVTAAGAASIQAAGLNLTSVGGAPTVETSSGDSNAGITGNVTRTIAGALAYVVALTIALTAGGIMTLTGGLGVAIVAAAGTVALGSLAGTKRKLVDVRFLTAHDAHTHPHGAGPGTTGVPTVLLAPTPTNFSTTNVEAD
jgi:hypothetical protein